MNKQSFLLLLLIFGLNILQAQGLRQTRELSVNGFRNPSIGLEYRHGLVSAHAGWYLTNFESGVTTQFVKTGLTWWLLPVGKREVPSSFYVGASYLRGLTRDYEGTNALGLETGFRWMIWRGLQLRIGAIVLLAPNQPAKLNPTPGLSYSFNL